MGIQHADYLCGERVFGCAWCHAHLVTSELIMSRAFTGRYGRAMLVHRVVNVAPGPPVERELTSGMHTVRDIVCRRCGQYLGWDYVEAVRQSEKYKLGKSVLERARIIDLPN